MNGFYHLFRKITAGHAGLIGDHDCQITIFMYALHRARRIRKQTKPRNMVDVSHFLRDRAVAVNENCALHFTCPARFKASLATSWQLGGTFLLASSACACAKSSSGVMAVMQRWSIGQSRNIQGAHSGGRRIISAKGEKGRVVKGLVGPKITSVGTSNAEAICAGPVSLVIKM